MPRVDLNVPFEARDEAKRLGGRWDGEQKTWYVPHGVNPAPFSQWIASEPDLIPIQAKVFAVHTSVRQCWKCGAATPITGLSMQAKVLDQPPSLVMPFYITAIDDLTLSDVRRANPHYQLKYSHATGHKYFMNLCHSCGAAQGDNFCFAEAGVLEMWSRGSRKTYRHPLSLLAGSVLDFSE